MISSPYKHVTEPSNKMFCGDSVSVKGLCKASRYNHTSAILSESRSHDSDRSFADDGVTGKYTVYLRCCSQIIKGRTAAMQKSAQDISQILFIV